MTHCLCDGLALTTQHLYFSQFYDNLFNCVSLPCHFLLPSKVSLTELQVLPVIFLLTVVIEALIPKEIIMRGFGEKSGFMGNLLALLLGSISAGPIYAAFPISKTLLGKGASISNIVIILSSWAVIKVPMLANEAKFLGVNFMIIRWVLTVIAIFIMAYITCMIVKKKDLPIDSKNAATLEIKADYCIGCGL